LDVGLPVTPDDLTAELTRDLSGDLDAAGH